ncbi:MAG TPA: barstar family protein [Burkholderiaceae bacterium]|nr:barstar family protein [Burkholderiaceae bacterium]
MATAEINGAAIVDFPSFHRECQQALGFPDSYTGTMDAWVDCLSYLRDEDGMTRFRLKPSELLDLVIVNAEAMRAQVPDILEEVTYCIAGINERYEDYGEKPALRLVLR